MVRRIDLSVSEGMELFSWEKVRGNTPKVIGNEIICEVGLTGSGTSYSRGQHKTDAQPVPYFVDVGDEIWFAHTFKLAPDFYQKKNSYGYLLRLSNWNIDNAARRFELGWNRGIFGIVRERDNFSPSEFTTILPLADPDPGVEHEYIIGAKLSQVDGQGWTKVFKGGVEIASTTERNIVPGSMSNGQPVKFSRIIVGMDGWSNQTGSLKSGIIRTIVSPTSLVAAPSPVPVPQPTPSYEELERQNLILQTENSNLKTQLQIAVDLSASLESELRRVNGTVEAAKVLFGCS